ncbi:MAG: MBOAT family protein [Eubacteriales bacterium]|nr:MBOAT family protein [Eubacteriales bacterium]
MAFQTFSYFLFLTLVFVVYYLLPDRFRWAFLLAASYFFYSCWNTAYALLMLLSTAITYLSGLRIGKADSLEDAARRKKVKKGWVALSFAFNLLILFAFKYANMFFHSLGSLTEALGVPIAFPEVPWLLPVGISFYTFQALGYTVDVYRGDVKAVRHFGKYALFVSFFPQLVAGPIERSSRLIAQFDEIHRPDFIMMRDGAFTILLGLCKKLLIADRVAVLVNLVYNRPGEYGAPAIALATVCFAFQIYCDFSGYSDIAVGSAKLLGFRLMKNFDAPYLSHSIAEFWRRWHISLSSWFRDYLYIPLGGSRVGLSRWILNTVIVFTASGLWHGADWTFVCWGALNGLYIVLGRLTSPLRDRLLHGAKNSVRSLWTIIATFFFTCFAWMFFRANTMAELLQILSRLCSVWELNSLGTLIYQVNGRECLLMAVLLLFLLLTEIIGKRVNLREKLYQCPLLLRWSVYLGLLFILILFGKYNESPAFIYFQF